MKDLSELKRILKDKGDFELSDQADLIPNFENEMDRFIYQLNHPEKIRQWRISDFKKHSFSEREFSIDDSAIVEGIWYTPNFSLVYGKFFLSDIFIDIANELTSLFRLYIYTNNHVISLMKQADKTVDGFDGNVDEESAMFVESMIESDKEYLPLLLKQSTVIMLYSFLERSLKTLVKCVSDMTHKNYMKDEYVGPTIERYIAFLRDKGEFEITFSKEFQRDFDTFRYIRNYYVHDGSSPDNYLLKMIRQNEESLVVEEEVRLTNDYILRFFEIAGDLLIYLQNGYMDAWAVKEGVLDRLKEEMNN